MVPSIQPFPSSPFRNTKDLTLLKRGSQGHVSRAAGVMNISSAIYVSPLLPLKPTPPPGLCHANFTCPPNHTLPSWPCYGAGADKNQTAEEPQTLQLYEELKGTWKLHTLEAAFF